MRKDLWRKRRKPSATYEEDDDAWFVDSNQAFSNDLFLEMPDMFSSVDLNDVADEWDLPLSVIECIYERIPQEDVN